MFRKKLFIRRFFRQEEIGITHYKDIIKTVIDWEWLRGELTDTSGKIYRLDLVDSIETVDYTPLTIYSSKETEGKTIEIEFSPPTVITHDRGPDYGTVWIGEFS